MAHQGRSERGGGRGCCGEDTPQYFFLSRHLEPQLANEASKVLQQGLVHNKFAVGKPRAMGLPTGFANVLCSSYMAVHLRVTNRLNSNQ